MQIGGIILARYNSRRLPGKALKDIGGKPILLQIYQALRQYFSQGNIVVATSSSPTDDPIAAFCKQHQIHCYRGSLDKVAERFYDCAKHFGFEFAFRINGDNLFVESRCIVQMMADVQQDASYDFLSNVKERTFPFGMSVELLNTEFYGHCLEKFQQDARYQEHVTLYLYENENIGERKYYFNTKTPEAKGAHLAIDTPEDFEIAQLIYAQMLEPNNTPPLADLIRYYKQAKKKYEASLER
ncbi:spore coat polysaccharide biosynthesis protein SpsF [Catalinimonas alkaloidigena]|uniref:cytidylyltransferase domain-containing protein n=1 Tax=Catalinimonas alkaloidigena TaxID=1075417 RepID=UPI002405F14D|nr:hypothetical protein [Catalinimonas alkaloidigena]MDF9798018.1 spore coat polysaccharide biosynthesis protein SpsF [Catalinimonas alkaloidigena]